MYCVQLNKQSGIRVDTLHALHDQTFLMSPNFIIYRWRIGKLMG